MTENLFAQRLRSARIMTGLSLEELASAIGNKVSKQALQKYEKGLMRPDSTVLLAIAKALKVKPDYFFREQNVPVSQIEFRKKSKMSVKEQNSIIQVCRDYLERYSELEVLLGIDRQWENPLKEFKVKNPADAEVAALKLRELWKLGLDAIPNLVETLEDNKFKVCEISAESDLDGMAAGNDKSAVILVNKNMRDVSRKRFTIAHELAHLLLNIETNKPKDKERICHRFAGALLLPAEIMRKEFGQKRSRFSLAELLALKQEYGISLQAIIRRAKDLEIISDSKYKGVCIVFSKNGWKINEPGEYIGEENPKRFNKILLRALSEEVISISKAAALANLSIEQMNTNAGPIL